MLTAQFGQSPALCCFVVAFSSVFYLSQVRVYHSVWSINKVPFIHLLLPFSIPFRLITSQPIYTQRLLVLLFGTFRVIASNSKQIGTGMSSEAIGVSVAPSFFQSCVSDGKTARMEDVLRYKVIGSQMKSIISRHTKWIFTVCAQLLFDRY